MVLLIGLATGAATLFGGVLALRYRSALGLFMGFSSGAVIGVALFDLLPEALDLAGTRFQALTMTTAVAIGFAAYLAVDRLAMIVADASQSPRGNFGPVQPDRP